MASSTSPRSPSGGISSPSQDKLPQLLENINPNKQQQEAPRRSSLGLLLRRTKSGEYGKQGSKKQQAHARELELQRQQREAANKPAPRLPALYNGAAPAPLQTFGGENSGNMTTNGGAYGSYVEPTMRSGNIPVPPIPSSNGTKQGNRIDPYARSESMTHRGRYSYASSAVSSINSPRRVRRRKDPTPFK